MKEYFHFRESSNNGWVITPHYEQFGAPYIEGSFSLFACRIMGVSWPDWLRLCEQNGARLYGKNSLYTCAIWKEPNKDFLKTINKRANEIAAQIDLKELNW